MAMTIDGTAGITYPDGAVQPTAGVGINQTWQNVTASRASGTTYTNTSGRPIEIIVRASGTSTVNAGSLNVIVSGLTLGVCTLSESNGTQWNGLTQTISVIVPNGATYSCTVTNGTINQWAELR